jgi:sugar diacid utilization regulator
VSAAGRTAGEGGAARTTLHVLGTLLDLLAEEATAAEVDALVEEVRAADLPNRALLAAEDGRRIRDLLAQRQRREAEMHALYETARDLTSLRDVDGALHAIVDRVRRLLNADITYIALADEESGEAYMRVTSGTVTAPIQHARQPLGWGVGGWILQTGQSFAAFDYLTDRRLRLDASVTAAVREEGIRGIAGAPMKLGTRVVGALFAADRRRREFDPSEIALLSSLADHAAVVIENARLFSGLRVATEELREVNSRLSDQRHVLERASAAHEQLMPLALARADVVEFAEKVSGILGGAVELVDTAGQILAAAGEGDPAAEPGTAPGELADRSVDASSGAVTESTHGRSREVAAVPVRAGRERFGSLRLLRDDPLTDAEMRTLERAAQTAALLLLIERQTSIFEEELRAELLDDLLADGAPDWDVVQRRAQRLGVLRPGQAQTVVVCSAPEVPLSHLMRAANDLAARVGGLASEHTGSVVLLLPVHDAAAIAREVAEQLARSLRSPVTAGASGPASTVHTVRALHPRAARCHRLLLALGREGDGSTLEELGVVGQVLEGATATQVQRVIDRTLGPLLAYDEDHSAALVDTLECYFAGGQSPPEAARRLQVHVNTVYQRLDRVDRVLGGPGWREPQGALEMQMALQLHQAAGRRAGQRPPAGG